MKLIVHADDFGLSKGITDSILDCVDHGAINSTSILANGGAFDYAMQEYHKRKGLRLSVHLNLVEGKPVLPASQVPLLVDQSGELYHSFQGLWIKYWTASSKEKHALCGQVRDELAAQIQKVVHAAGPGYSPALDSHCHYHILPFVFELVLGLCKEFQVQYLRLPLEPFFISLGSPAALKNYLGLNMVKHLLANCLMRGKKGHLRAMSIGCNDHFIGVLCAAGMRGQDVQKALGRIHDPESIVEILFHPGQAAPGEEALLKKEFAHNYYAPWQLIEQAALKDPAFRDLLKTYGL